MLRRAIIGILGRTGTLLWLLVWSISVVPLPASITSLILLGRGANLVDHISSLSINPFLLLDTHGNQITNAPLFLRGALVALECLKFMR